MNQSPSVRCGVNSISAVISISIVSFACRLLCSLTCSIACFACTEGSAKSRSVSSAGAPSNPAEARGIPHTNQAVRGSIVVLGSSTAAGTGPKDPNNAWVWRYKATLARQFPNVTLVNLAIGGLSTFELQPTGYRPPPNRPAPVEGNNITAALALNPSAIIVNLPSNDQANNYPLAEQLANYERIASLARSAQVLLWISTTQPRNFNDVTQRESLTQARDAITTRFAPRTLDFWTPFATTTGFIKASYNSGDDTHLNDEAHAVLAGIVEAAHIPQEIAGKSPPSP